MARISQYEQDSTLNKADKVLGTDSATGATKNFSLESITSLVNDENLVEIFDGAAFTFQDYVDPASTPNGVLNLNAGTATTAAFSAINVIYISVRDKSGLSLAEYLDNTANDFIKINKTDNLNNFGIFEVTAIESFGSGEYRKLTVTPRGSNGNLTVGTKYFVANYSALFDQDFSDDSVTEFGDVTNAGSGQIITNAERTSLNNFTANGLLHSDVVDNTTSTTTDVPLSANQGKVLKDLIDTINALLVSDNTDLDSLQEVVDFIEANKDTLDNLSISNIAGLQAALDAKEDSVTGKGLSANDFTDSLLNKLTGIAAGAEVNVQANWNETNSGADAFILNKPSDLTDLSTHNVTELSDVTSAGSGSIISSAERTKLTSVDTGAEVNVQADYTETDTNSDAFIQNKPDLTLKADKATTIQVNGTTNEIEVSPTGAQDLSANRAFTIGLPNDVTIGEDLKVNETIELVNAQSSTPTFDNGIYYSTEDNHDTLHFRYHGHDLSIDYLTENIPTGILNGGELSTNTNTTFDVAAGDGIINILNKNNSDPHPEIKKVAWSATTVTHTLGDANNADQLNTWIYVNSSGTVVQTLTTPTPAIWRNNIVLGSVIHSSNVIRFVKTFPRTAYSAGNTYAEFVEIFGPLKKTGHLLTVNSTNTLALDRAAGESFALGRNYETDPLNPSLVSDGASTPVFHRYSSTSTGFTKDDGPNGAGYAAIDPTKYDNNGTLANVSGGHYSVQRLYHFPNNTNVIVVYYGKAEYNSLDVAEKSYLLENFQEAENTANQAIFLGALIVKGNSTDLGNSSEAKILTGGIFRSLSAANLGGVAANSALSDLSDVNIQSVADKQVIQYNSSTSRFENVTDLDLGGNKVLFGNLYANESDLPSASTYHGMFAHVHATGKGYFAHGGAWRKLLDETSSTTDNLTEGSTNEYFTNTKADARADLRIAAADIGDLSNVDLTGIANNKILKYNSTTSQFEPVDDSGGDTYTLSASQDGDNVDILLDAGSGTDSTLQLTAGNNITLTRDSAQAVTIASTGGGGGTSSVTRNTASGNGSTVNFTLSQSISNENNTFVYIDGVYQSKLGYSVSGNVLTFSQAPPTGTDNIEVISYASIAAQDASNIVRDEFVGNGTQTAFTLSAEPRGIDATWVFLQGVFQEKTHYSISGTTLTFDTAPQNTFSVEVISITGVINVANVGQVQNDTFTGNGTQTAYTLSLEPANTASCNVFINGVYQQKSTYSLAGTTLTFTTAPSNGDSIEIESKKTILPSAVSYANMASDTFTGNGSTTVFALTNGSPQSEEYTIVHINGVYQNKSTYGLSGTNLSFTTAPANGDSIEVVSISSVNAQASESFKRYNVEVISSNTTAAGHGYLYVLTASLTLTLPASPINGDSIKISNRSGTQTCVLGANGNKIMGASANLTLDTASASFELIYSGSAQGWVIIGQ